MSHPEPSWVGVPLRCTNCGYAWDDWAPSGVTVLTLVGYLQALRCNRCRREHLVIEIGPPDATQAWRLREIARRAEAAAER